MHYTIIRSFIFYECHQLLTPISNFISYDLTAIGHYAFYGTQITGDLVMNDKFENIQHNFFYKTQKNQSNVLVFQPLIL